jgi:hypothetical protein
MIRVATAVVVLALCVLAAGCGGDEAAPARHGPWSVEDVRAVFSRGANVKLSASRLGRLTRLEPPGPGSPGDPTGLYGLFSVTVTREAKELQIFTRDSDGRDIQPTKDGIYWSRLGSGWHAAKVFDNVVLEWSPDPLEREERRTTEKWDRLVAILGNLGKSPDDYRLNEDDVPCEQAGIAPVGPGKEGACRLAGQTLVIVNRDTPLEFPDLRVDGVRLRTEETVSRPLREVGLRPKGLWVFAEYRIENIGEDLLTATEPNLVVGDRRYENDAVGTRLEPDQPSVLDAGKASRGIVVFDVPATAASRVGREGALEFNGDDHATIEDADTVGRIRLSPP